MTEIIFATRNKNKLKEVQSIMPPTIHLLTLDDISFVGDIEETSDTIEGNSLLKAQTIFDLYNKPVFAEDTGLEVFALNNEPGVYSSRYAGEHGDAAANMEKLLENLKGVKNREAQFKTVLTYINTGIQEQFTGIILGEITENIKGNKGFGYDPIFKPAGFNQVFAEMDDDTKNNISHRSIALKRFLTYLEP